MEKYVLNLQRFAEVDDEELELDEDEELEGEEDQEPDEEPEEGTENGEGETEEEGEEELADKKKQERMYPKSKVEQVVQKRVQRLEREYNRKIAEAEAKGVTELRKYAGDNLNETELREAAKLYAYLKANPQHGDAINNLLKANPWQNHPQFKEEQTGPDPVEALRKELAVKDTINDLRADPAFKKYEARIKEYAEDEGFDFDDPKQIRQAYKAWRGENARLIAANARLAGQREAASSKDKQKSAKLQGSAGPRGQKKVNPSKLSDSEFLQRKGISLFTED